MTDTNTPAQQATDPQEGGRYVRNADGSLTRIHKTDDAQLEAKDQPAAALAQPLPAGGNQE